MGSSCSRTESGSKVRGVTRPLPFPVAVRPSLAWCLCLSFAVAGCLRLAAAEDGLPSGVPSTLPEASKARPNYLFFPPSAPPLDLVFPRLASARNSAPAASAELAPFAGEFFYPQLASRLHEHNFPSRLQSRLDDYLAARHRAQQEVREQIAAAPAGDPAARRRALQDFARRQAPRLAELERTAEALRDDLLLVDRDWSAFRQWHLGDVGRRGFSPVEISGVVRAYAFFHKGLSATHRLLLREISAEFLMAGETAEDAAANQRYLFFSPAYARVTLPDPLPPEVAAKVAAFQAKKAALKKELFEAVSAEEASHLPLLSNPLRSTATKQAPVLAELEALAEDIRWGLAQVGTEKPQRERSDLSPALLDRLDQVMRDRTKARQDADARFTAVIKRMRDRVPVIVSYRFEGDTVRYGLASRRRGADVRPEEAAQLKPELDAIVADYNREMAELADRHEALRREALAQAIDRNPGAVEAALDKALRIIAQRTAASAYDDYRIAVFEPGLLPEQRRVMFAAAIARLDLPLPRGEWQPTQLNARW